MRDLVTVVTVSHNSAAFIDETLQSVQAQSYRPLEHVVFDACSDDGTQEVLARREGRYDLRWSSEPDRGQSHAFNKGIAASRGRWLYFLNADDYLVDKMAIDNVMGWIESHPGFSIYMGHVISVDAEGRRTQGFTTPFAFPVYTRDVLLHQHGTVVHQGTFYERSVFDKAGMYSEKFRTHMDYEFHLRASRDFHIAAMEVDVACMRAHRGAKSQQPNPRRFLELMRARRQHGGRLLHRHNAFFVKGLLATWRYSAPAYRAAAASRLVHGLARRWGWRPSGLE